MNDDAQFTNAPEGTLTTNCEITTITGDLVCAGNLTVTGTLTVDGNSWFSSQSETGIE